VGAGLRVAASGVEHEDLSLVKIAVALAVPVAVLMLTVFATWSVLMRSYDFSHVPLLAAVLVPLIAAVYVGFAGPDGPIDPTQPSDSHALTAIIVLVALSAVIEVVGHEMVGYDHTLEVVTAELEKGHAREA